MDYIWIGIRTFTYVIIFTLIKIIVPKLLGNVKYKKDKCKESPAPFCPNERVILFHIPWPLNGRFPMVMLRSILVPGDRTRVYILAQMVAFLVHEYYRQ